MSAWLCGAICQADRKVSGIIMPRCDSETISLLLDEQAHAAALLERARWQGSPVSGDHGFVMMLLRNVRIDWFDPLQANSKSATIGRQP